MAYVVGADIGPQSVKGVLLDAAGQTRALACAPLTIAHPRPGLAEQDPAHWERALTSVVRQLLATSGVHGSEVTALSLPCQVDGVVPVDAQGEALAPAIIWLDRRAEAQTADLLGRIDQGRLLAITGLVPDSSHTAPKIMWLRDNLKNVFDRAAAFPPAARFPAPLPGRHHAGARLLTIAEPLVGEVCARAGFEVVEDPFAADVAVVSFDRTFDYSKLLAGYRAVKNGAVIVSTNLDPYCPTADGGLPDCAAMLAALEACTGRTAEAVVGKPSCHMGKAILDRLGVEPGRAAMVGDRLDTDVAMGQALGMAGVLVLSGATRSCDIEASSIRPDYVVASLADVVPTPADIVPSIH